MNEDFLLKFRQAPRTGFTQSLYTKLAQDAEIRPSNNRHSTTKRISYVITVLCLMFALAVVASPAVRAAALAAVDSIIATIKVRGTTVFINNDSPPVLTEVLESYSVIWTPVSPDDIVADYPFFAKIPTWVPAGYVLQERAALYFVSIHAETPHHALFEWKNNISGEIIQLEVIEGSCPNGPGTSQVPTSDCTLLMNISVSLKNEPQVIAVHDQPAVFFRGVQYITDLSGPVREWNPDRGKPTEDGTKGAWMTWENEGRTFTLAATSKTVTKRGLLRVAESIP